MSFWLNALGANAIESNTSQLVIDSWKPAALQGPDLEATQYVHRYLHMLLYHTCVVNQSIEMSKTTESVSDLANLAKIYRTK